MTQLSELDAELPILLLVTNDVELECLPEDLCELFHEEDEEIFQMRPFTEAKFLPSHTLAEVFETSSDEEGSQIETGSVAVGAGRDSPTVE